MTGNGPRFSAGGIENVLDCGDDYTTQNILQTIKPLTMHSCYTTLEEEKDAEERESGGGEQQLEHLWSWHSLS